MDKADRLAGALEGLLIGDALGVPYEFHPPQAIPDEGLIEFEPPPGFKRAHHGTPPGTWSDDGAQALCLLASLLECGRLDPDDLGRRLVRWLDEGYCAVDGRVFDVGIQTHGALSNLKSGVPAHRAGGDHERTNGNGSLMRVLPLALWHRGTDAELAADARLQSRVTHGHVRAQVCCALYCLWARRVLDEDPNPWQSAVGSLREVLGNDRSGRAELDGVVRPDAPAEGTGSGYVLDCLHSARWAVEQGPTYEATVRRAIRLGHDTDTTACVAGGIAGLRHGLGGIPERWRSALRGRDLLLPLLDGLIARGGTARFAPAAESMF